MKRCLNCEEACDTVHLCSRCGDGFPFELDFTKLDEVTDHYNKKREQNYLMSDEWRNQLIRDMVSQAAIYAKIETQNCAYVGDMLRKAARELTYAHYELAEIKHELNKLKEVQG